MMRTYGAEVILTPSVPFSDARHYFHVAAARGNEKGYFFTNQFENVANSRSHYEGTAPENPGLHVHEISPGPVYVQSEFVSQPP